MTPVESDEALVPIDVSKTDEERFLFFLAGRAPVALRELTEDTKQSADALRNHIHEELQNEVDIDSTDFVRLRDAARNSIIRASKQYVQSGQDEVAAGRAAVEQDSLHDAVDHFSRALEMFEQVQSRLGAVNSTSDQLAQLIKTVHKLLEEAQGGVGDSANQVEALLDDDQPSTGSGALSESPTADSSSDAKSAMLETIRDLYARLGRVPKTTDLPEDCDYSHNDFYKEFGSWDEALEAAGIDKEQELLKDLERVAEELGRVPNSTDMDDHGRYSGSNYSSFFGSWNTALQRADINDSREEELIETLQSLNSRLERIPFTTDLHDISGISQHDYIRCFGSWDEALEAAGINKEEHLIEDLKRVATEVGGKPGTPDVNRLGKYSATMHQKYFGSWDAALEVSNLSSDRAKGESAREIRKDHETTEALSKSTPIESITSHIDSLGPQSVWRLKGEEYTTLGDLLDVDPREITRVRGIGRKKATELVRFANEKLSGSQGSLTDQYRETASTSSRSTDTTGESPKGIAALGPTTSIDRVGDHVKGVGSSTIHAAKKAGYDTLGALADANVREIMKSKGVGKAKASRLVRFAEENISQDDTATEQPSSDRSSDERKSPSNQRASDGRLQPKALESSWETIPSNERISGQFLVQVTDVGRSAGSRKTAQLTVQDLNGRKFAMDVWSKHSIGQEWKEGCWYALENARGKVWESSDGTTRKRLSSTKDLDITVLGRGFDPDTASSGNTSDSGPPSQESGASDNRDRNSTNQPTDVGEEASTEAPRAADGNDDSESDETGIIDDIMSDFDDF